MSQFPKTIGDFTVSEECEFGYRFWAVLDERYPEMPCKLFQDPNEAISYAKEQAKALLKASRADEIYLMLENLAAERGLMPRVLFRHLESQLEWSEEEREFYFLYRQWESLIRMGRKIGTR